jgi:hypothetical protein
MGEFLQLITALRAIHVVKPITNPDVLRILALGEIEEGAQPEDVARNYGFSRSYMVRKLEQLHANGLVAIIPDLADQTTEQRRDKRRKGIAQMLLGMLAERQFIKLASEITGGREFSIEDHLADRSDTDYRLFNGQQRPLLRMNIKFHGTLFRQAMEMVGLPPEDCFALATYKINLALRRQENEALPFAFFILSAPGITAESIAGRVSSEDVWTLCACRGRRQIEEGIVARLLGGGGESEFDDVLQRMTAAQFRVISAKRAYNLMRELLFQRVFALRTRAFTTAFRRAEIDMHLSLSNEMTPIQDFFNLVTRLSSQELAVRLDRGEI